MSNSIIASNIPQSVTKDKVQEFFSFCGKIDNIEEEKGSEKTNSFRVTFLSASAVSTALLLNGAELGGSPVTVTSETSTTTATSQPPVYAEKADESVAVSETAADQPTADIAQELKPKAAIFAEYLSQGYVLGDHLVQQAVDHDKKHGYSDKFKKFLTDIDTKYNLQDKQKDLQVKQSKIDSKYKISSNLNKYFDKAIKTNVGSRLHGFYTNVVNDSLQIHEEAKRLADLKKQQNSGSTTPVAAQSEAESTPVSEVVGDVKTAPSS